MKKQILILTLAIFALSVSAQQAETLQFEERIHDFGEIKEEVGAAEYEFKFINNGTEPIKIVGVKASCGCTTPSWTREAVQPGASGFIKARYSTTNRPGSFNKSLKVTTDSKENALVQLYIKGRVTPKAKSIAEDLPVAMGGIRVKYSSFNMGKAYTNNEPLVKSFDVVNTSEQPIAFKDSTVGPSYISVAFDPAVLAVGQKGKIIVSFMAKDRNDLGFVSDHIDLFTDEEGEAAKKSFSVNTSVQEYFPPMTAEALAKAPKLDITTPMVDFGTIAQGEKASAKYTLTNNGKSVLDIRMTKSTCSCIAIKLNKEKIKPGKSIELEMTFDSTDRRGNQQKSISIFTNDPKSPVQRLTLKGLVKVQ